MRSVVAAVALVVAIGAESVSESVDVEPLLEEAAAGHRVACHLVHRGRESTQLLDLASEPA